jgi:hypothetical protein
VHWPGWPSTRFRNGSSVPGCAWRLTCCFVSVIGSRTRGYFASASRFARGLDLWSVNLQESRRFYEEVFGFEVVELGKVSLLLRKGGEHTYVVVETGDEDHKMSLTNHNDIDVGSPEEVERTHATLTSAPLAFERGLRSSQP